MNLSPLAKKGVFILAIASGMCARIMAERGCYREGGNNINKRIFFLVLNLFEKTIEFRVCIRN